ncbi:hypothetical protein ACW9HC_09065 [Nocardia gipuzkoensis]
MRDLEVSTGIVRNHAEIVALAERYRDLFEDHPATTSERSRAGGSFDPFRDSEYEDDDRYHTLQGARMPDDLRQAVLDGIVPARTDITELYVQINRYDPGDYVLPHRDRLQQGLYVLTTSNVDSLVVQDAAGRPVRLPDRAGNYITHDPAAWHWVDPVVDTLRYTIVTIPALVYR